MLTGCCRPALRQSELNLSAVDPSATAERLQSGRSQVAEVDIKSCFLSRLDAAVHNVGVFGDGTMSQPVVTLY